MIETQWQATAGGLRLWARPADGWDWRPIGLVPEGDAAAMRELEASAPSRYGAMVRHDAASAAAERACRAAHPEARIESAYGHQLARAYRAVGLDRNKLYVAAITGRGRVALAVKVDHNRPARRAEEE